MLTMRQKQAITKELKMKYRKATKKKKNLMLDDFCSLTEYNRTYASRILRKEYVSCKSNKIEINKRKIIYDNNVFSALVKVWIIADGICGKRLAPFLPELLDKLIQHKEIRVSKKVYGKLTRISAATIDRLLKNTKKKMMTDRKGVGGSGSIAPVIFKYK